MIFSDQIKKMKCFYVVEEEEQEGFEPTYRRFPSWSTVSQTRPGPSLPHPHRRGSSSGSRWRRHHSAAACWRPSGRRASERSSDPSSACWTGSRRTCCSWNCLTAKRSKLVECFVIYRLYWNFDCSKLNFRTGTTNTMTKLDHLRLGLVRFKKFHYWKGLAFFSKNNFLGQLFSKNKFKQSKFQFNRFMTFLSVRFMT